MIQVRTPSGLPEEIIRGNRAGNGKRFFPVRLSVYSGMEPSARLIQYGHGCGFAREPAPRVIMQVQRVSGMAAGSYLVNTVQCADCNSKHYTEQHCYYYWNIVASFQKCSRRSARNIPYRVPIDRSPPVISGNVNAGAIRRS